MALAEFLHEEIKKRNVSKAQFASDMGILITQLNRILNKASKKKTPSEEVLANLAKNLGLSRDELIKICFDESAKLIYGSYPELQKKVKTLTVSDIVDNIMENDISNQIPEESKGTKTQWENLILNYPDSCCFFYDTEINRVVGDWSIVALNNEQKEEIITTGNINDEKIDFQTAESLVLAGYYDIYLYNMSFIPAYNTAEYISIMLESFCKKIYALGENSIFIHKLYAKALNPRERSFFKGLGFSPIKKSDRLFEISNFPTDLICSYKEPLTELYKKQKKGDA